MRRACNHINAFTRHLIIVLASLLLIPMACAAGTDGISSEWGGYLRAIGTLSSPDDRSIYQFTETGTYFDSQGELRIKNELFAGSRLSFETHYELVGQKGDTLANSNRLAKLFPASATNTLTGSRVVDDGRRLMNLTHTLDEGEDHVVYHRLDRLNLTYNAGGTSVRLGRQALTWGNGLLFNPMDLFNPFAPTTVQRDYKSGDDMVHFQIPAGNSEVQFLYLPRRSPVSGDIENDQSSVAGKWHFPRWGVDFDIMAASHYGDMILATGATGYIGGAAWRGDLVYTILDDGTVGDDFLQMVVNMDYAWQWGGKTVYGLIEFFYNGSGEEKDYSEALSDPVLAQRIDRGELFTLGRTYLVGQLNIELHPLVQAGLTVITNLADPSAIFQPRLTWDVATDLQLILGANINRGGNASEFGGFETTVGGTTVKAAPADSQYLWLTYYF